MHVTDGQGLPDIRFLITVTEACGTGLGQGVPCDVSRVAWALGKACRGFGFGQGLPML